MKKRYRNVAFLVELLVDILVLSISYAVLVGLFGKAAELTKRTKEEGLAYAQVQVLVETAKVRGFEDWQGGGAQENGEAVYYYDARWEEASPEEALYTVQLQCTPEQKKGGVLNHVKAVAGAQDGRELCVIETAVYRPDTGGTA